MTWERPKEIAKRKKSRNPEIKRLVKRYKSSQVQRTLKWLKTQTSSLSTLLLGDLTLPDGFNAIYTLRTPKLLSPAQTASLKPSLTHPLRPQGFTWMSKSISNATRLTLNSCSFPAPIPLSAPPCVHIVPPSQ